MRLIAGETRKGDFSPSVVRGKKKESTNDQGVPFVGRGWTYKRNREGSRAGSVGDSGSSTFSFRSQGEPDSVM